jgi:hypothetical protein
MQIEIGITNIFTQSLTETEIPIILTTGMAFSSGFTRIQNSDIPIVQAVISSRPIKNSFGVIFSLAFIDTPSNVDGL